MVSLEFESSVQKSTGCLHIAGLDEAGRGALAGPVVAAAVILPLEFVDKLDRLNGVNDSKQLSGAKRILLDDKIRQFALTFGIGSQTASYIDRFGIIAATKQAMLDALNQLDPQACFLLIDGRIRLNRTTLPQKSIIRGDSRSLSIAAASIVAKVARDNLMIELDALYPEYGFAQHKGYGTEAHRDVLQRIGPSPVHRYSFSPLKPALF